MDTVRKGFGNEPLKNFTMERKRVEEFEESLRYRLWMSQSCFSLGFLSQNSLWKLSLNRKYKGIYIVGWKVMWKVSFSQTGCFGNLTSRLGWVASSSRKQTTWPAWDFCLVVQQLVQLFSFWHAWYMCIILVACSHESLFLCTILSNSSHSLTHYLYMIPA